MTKVKFCGFTNLENTQNALDLGVNYLGFNFYEKSPRHISVLKYQEIYSRLIFTLNPKVQAVAVLVNPNENLVNQILDCGIKILQFHGQEPVEFCLQFKKPGIEIWKAVSQELSLQKIKQYLVLDKILLDSPKKADYTSGKEHFSEFEKFIELKQLIPTILAGGLNLTNITQYLEILKPEIVDIASGIEISPGIKDENKMSNFMQIFPTTN